MDHSKHTRIIQELVEDGRVTTWTEDVIGGWHGTTHVSSVADAKVEVESAIDDFYKALQSIRGVDDDAFHRIESAAMNYASAVASQAVALMLDTARIMAGEERTLFLHHGDTIDHGKRNHPRG